MVTFKGHCPDWDPNGLYDGYDVILDGQRIGFIGICGIFRKDVDCSLTENDLSIVREMCKRVYEMPSEYGCLGVGESPITSFDEFIRKTSIHHDLD